VAGIKPNKHLLAEAKSVLYVNKHKVSRLNSSLYAVMPTVSSVLACDSLNTVPLYLLYHEDIFAIQTLKNKVLKAYKTNFRE